MNTGMPGPQAGYQASSSGKQSAVLLGITAGLALLSLIVPVASGSDAKLIEGGLNVVVGLLLPTVLILVGVLGPEEGGLRGLAIGATIAVASLLGVAAVSLWVIAQGEGFGLGAWIFTLLPIVGVVAVVRALPAMEQAFAPPVLKYGLAAAVVLSVGQTLVPSEASSLTWTRWNAFEGTGGAARGMALLIANFAPVISAGIALRKGGRAGALCLAGGSIAWILATLMAKAGFFDDSRSEFLSTRILVHPVAVVGALALGAIAAIAVATIKSSNDPALAAHASTFGVSTPSSSVAPSIRPPAANPPRWAADPLRRHELRYWDGAKWTEHVSDRGVTSRDDGLQPAPPQPSAPTTVMPAMERPVIAASPVAPPPTPTVPASVPAAAPAPTQTFAPPSSVPLDATVDRMMIRGMRADLPSFTIVLDDGSSSQHSGVVLVGREPSARASDTNPSILAVVDPTMSVSKSHLAIGCDASGVWIQDRGSTNGSAVTMPDGRTIAATPEEVQRVPNGSRIMFGDRWLEVR